MYVCTLNAHVHAGILHCVPSIRNNIPSLPGHTRLLPTFKDKHIDSGFTSQLLYELITHESSTSEHINYLLFKVKVDSKRAPHLFYNASKVSASQLLKKSVRELKAYELLIDYGMPVMAEDIAYAVHVLPNSKHELLKLLVNKCEDCSGGAYDKAVETSLKANKKQFISVLKGGTKVSSIPDVLPSACCV